MTDTQDSDVDAKSRYNRIRSLIVSAYAAKALAMVTIPIMTRVLGPDGRGQYAAAMTFSTFAVAMSTAGFGYSVAHELANTDATESELIGSSLKYTLWLVLPCILLVGLLYIPPLNNAPEGTKIAALLLFWITPFTAMANAALGIFTARGELSTISIFRIAPVAVSSVVLVGLAITGHLTPATAIISYSTSIVANALLSPLLLRVRPVWTHSIRPLLRFTFRSIPAQLAMMANRSLDQLLVAPLLGFRELGFYSVSVAISTIPLSISGAVSLRSFSQMGSRTVFDGEAAARFVRLTGLVVIVLCVIIAIPSPLMIPLVFGQAFSESTLPLLLLLPGTVALCIAQVTDQAFTLIGRPGTASIIELFTLLLTVVGLAFTLDTYGIPAAAAVSSLSYILRFMLSRHVLRSHGLGRVTPKLSEWRDALKLITRE